jgi:hypothetical protein
MSFLEEEQRKESTRSKTGSLLRIAPNSQFQASQGQEEGGLNQKERAAQRGRWGMLTR